jgi:hypothetical protein
MNEQSKNASPGAAAGRGIGTLHLKYGNLASAYAKVRAEAAQDAGEESDAVHWKKVEKSLAERDQ